MGDNVWIAEIEEHRVRTGETLDSIARSNGLSWQKLARFNWGTTDPDVINRHLRDSVGCTKKTADGYNYVFTSDDTPGIVLVPREWKRTGLETDLSHQIRVRRARGFRIILENEYGLRIPEAEYEATLSNGAKVRGRLGKSGIALIKNPPPGKVMVEFLDLDDVKAKSLAACARKAFDDRDYDPVWYLLKESPEIVRLAVEAYDRHFNDYTGRSLVEDIYQEFSSDEESSTAAEILIAIAGLKTRNPITILEPER